MYFIKSSRFVGSSSLPISCFLLSVSSISCSLYILNVNEMSWCYILYSLGYLANCIVLIFQFTSGLYLTNQLYSKNISVSFKSITAMLIFSVCLLISHSSGTNLVTSSFLVLSALKTSNYLFISSIFICSSFTSCLSISVWVHPESTSTFNHSSFLFDVLTFVHMLSPFFLLFFLMRNNISI